MTISDKACENVYSDNVISSLECKKNTHDKVSLISLVDTIHRFIYNFLNDFYLVYVAAL